jgi:hypothetical protein
LKELGTHFFWVVLQSSPSVHLFFPSLSWQGAPALDFEEDRRLGVIFFEVFFGEDFPTELERRVGTLIDPGPRSPTSFSRSGLRSLE